MMVIRIDNALRINLGTRSYLLCFYVRQAVSKEFQLPMLSPFGIPVKAVLKYSILLYAGAR